MRNLAPRTIRNYLSTIRKLACFSSKSLLDLTRDDVAGFLHHELTVEKLAPASINLHIGSLKTFYSTMTPGSRVTKKHLIHESARNIACRSLTIPLA
ncbi:MAG: phage integrase N-terminal SAM-like domain-containing protein, partial [bacterium]